MIWKGKDEKKYKKYFENLMIEINFVFQRTFK